jgi:hypothetical protein
LVLPETVSKIGTSTNFMGRLSTMLLWNELDPPDDAERKRNDLLFERYQGNRNPLVDFPEWARLVFGPTGHATHLTNSLVLSWPVDFANAIFESSTNAQTGWTTALGVRTNSTLEVLQTETVTVAPKFFRLRLR